VVEIVVVVVVVVVVCLFSFALELVLHFFSLSFSVYIYLHMSYPLKCTHTLCFILTLLLCILLSLSTYISIPSLFPVFLSLPLHFYLSIYLTCLSLSFSTTAPLILNSFSLTASRFSLFHVNCLSVSLPLCLSFLTLSISISLLISQSNSIPLSPVPPNSLSPS
jgi:hypothetical protein